MMDVHPLLESLCEASRRLHGRGLLAACDGNLSARMEDGRIALTPSGVNKSRIRPEDMAFLDASGKTLSGQPSSEFRMHLAIYKACPEARAVVHAHPPTAIAWTLAHPELSELPAEALPELLLAADRVPIVPYARPGTEAVAEAVSPFLPQHRLLLLARHGGLAWGASLDEACDGLERLEHAACILKSATELGRIVNLPKEEVLALRAIREKMGPGLR